MYVNNFLTLLIWRGELEAADALAELNVRALSWIVEPWKRCTQIEHGFSSLGYLRLLQGDLRAATACYELAAVAWDAYDADRQWFFDYYPFYRAELRLALDPDAHELALEDIRVLLAVAEVYRWPESICRGHIQAALVHMHEAERSGELGPLTACDKRPRGCGARSRGDDGADVRITHMLSRIKLALLASELSPRDGVDRGALSNLIDQAEMLVESSGLALPKPEITGARGALAYLRGSLEAASALCTEALAECSETSNHLAIGSTRSPLGWLRVRLDMPSPVRPLSGTAPTSSRSSAPRSPGSGCWADLEKSRPPKAKRAAEEGRQLCVAYLMLVVGIDDPTVASPNALAAGKIPGNEGPQ